ncbi:MAG: hypothetical protein SFW08_10655 [Gemmatimonadaceae bacterium]|nr:hypothetical protein [Gemmatimonadaceae bacterium]
MLPYTFYKVVHIFGIALTLSSLGGMAVHALNGGTKSENSARRLLISMHGAGVLFILVGGFGMLARLGFQHGAMFPGWLWMKLGVWTLFAGLIALPYRKPALARPTLIALPFLAATAAAMAVYKPF